ncbi:uncharacterized protein ora6 [Eucyclogobius newberryi]|uniref:uncharacterized protein ora6 n=1 Tax=Eucyclogobius newberryi TaxID=166745 RepID=UPI003B5BEFC6
MAEFSHILVIRIFVSCVGCIGNLILIFSITHSHVKMSSVKSFEVFLLGLAVSNLEEIVMVNMYDTLNIVVLEDPTARAGNWPCRSLKFLTVSGELGSILFTVVICIFRYEKLRDAAERVNRPTHLDNLTAAVVVSGFCLVLSLALSAPIFVTSAAPTKPERNSTGVYCPPDFFQCDEHRCPTLSYAYKYFFVVFCNVLPMFVVTVTSCLIVAVLLRQRQRVEASVHTSGLGPFGKTKNRRRHHRSTVAVLAAMGLFQVDWSLYLFLQLNSQTTNLAFWTEMKFFVSTSYTSISPYVFGIGNNLFSVKRFARK